MDATPLPEEARAEFDETMAAEAARRTSPRESKHLPKPTQTWSNLETVERTEVKKGVPQQVEMIALETYDRDREPEPHEMPRTLAALQEQGFPERCGTDLDAILESEEALVEMGALGKNHAVGSWWDRIRQVDTPLNARELPAWAEAQKLPEVRHLIENSRTKRARTELPPQ